MGDRRSIPPLTQSIPLRTIYGVYMPGTSCNAQSVERAVNYGPNRNDIFVVTQMKGGTTWMQPLVYESLCRGRGDLSDEGHGHMAAVSPWLESFNGVSVDDAPLVDFYPDLAETES